MNSIKQYQEDMKKEHYDYIKSAIVSNIKSEIKNNPDIDSVNYYNNSIFTFEKSPIWIYSEIDAYFNDLARDLKDEGVTLRKIEVYKAREVGIFKKKTIKEFDYDYYNLTWN